MPIYMQISGIDGDVTAKGHEQWIELHSFDFAVKRALNTQPGRIVDREGTRPAVSEVTVSKKVNKSSPLLFNEACTGTAKPTVKIHFCTTGNSLQSYMEYTLSNVMFSGYAVDLQPQQMLESTQGELSVATKSPEHPLETLTLNFDKIEVKFTPYDDTHKAQTPVAAGYDLKQATAV